MGWTLLVVVLVLSMPLVGFYLAGLMNKKQADKFAAWQRQQEEEEKKKQHEANQLAVSQLILGFESNSMTIINGLPNDIGNAESGLDDAEREFTEGAFAPFWDAIERAVNSLARFDFGVQQLLGQFNNCKHELRRLEVGPQTVQFDVTAIPDAASTSTRLQEMVRRAQKNFQFATIYEQRKTNQLLVAGFSSLGQALSVMSERITSSIDALADSMADSINELTVSNYANAEAVVASVDALNQQVQSDAASQRGHERAERDMLDNIQRRRKPLI